MNFKTLIIGFLCFVSTAAYGQHDFDYTIYTTRHTATHEEDTLSNLIDATLYRKFTKTGSELRQTSVFNTANEIIYRIEFIGFTSEVNNHVIAYRVISVDGKNKEKMFLFVSPLYATVIFREEGHALFYE